MTVWQLKNYLENFDNELEINTITKLNNANKIYIEFKIDYEKKKEENEK